MAGRIRYTEEFKLGAVALECHGVTHDILFAPRGLMLFVVWCCPTQLRGIIYIYIFWLCHNIDYWDGIHGLDLGHT